MANRDELAGWIAETKRFQRKLAIVVGALTALSLALGLWRKPVGGLGIALAVVVAAGGFWITSSHIAGWQAQLEARRGRSTR